MITSSYAIRKRQSASESPWWLADNTIDAANAIAVYQPKGAADLATSYVNLANPGTYDAALGVAPTFNTATGWTFNGSDQYLDTGVIDNRGLSLVVRFTISGITVDDYILGSYSGTSGTTFGISPYDAGSVVRYSIGQSFDQSPQLTAGVLAIVSRYPSTGEGYRDGAIDASSVNTYLDLAGYAIYIGARNNSGTADRHASCVIQAFAIYDTTLTADQVAAVSTAMAAL